MKCSNCNAWIPDDALFCSECGQKVAPASFAPQSQGFCPECGTPLLSDDMFCGGCGARNAAYGQASAPVAVKGGKKKKGFKLPVKALIIGGVAVALVAVVLFVVSLFAGGGTDRYAVYIKDRELMAASLPKGQDPMQLTDKLVDSYDVSNEDLADAYLGYYLALSADGKRMFYPDKVDDDGFSLYYRNINNSKKEPVKIDSGLEDGYIINESGTLVTYIKNDNLYQHDLTEKTKISGDVYDFDVSTDGKTLVYMKDYNSEEGADLYLKKGSADAEKIASGVSLIKFTNDDLSVILYLKEDSLYRVLSGKDPEKIASDVYSVYAISDSGACYYTQQEEKEIEYVSVLTNDRGSEGSYYMDWLEGDTMYNPVKTLVYFDGKESTVITETMVGYPDYSSEAQTIVYGTLESGELPVLKLSEYMDGSESISTMLENAMEEDTVYCIANGTKTSELSVDEFYDARVADDGTVYVLTEYDSEDYTCSLYKVTMADGKIKSCDMVDDEVYYSTSLTSNNILYYWKDYDYFNDCGELYMNGQKVDDDVYFYSRYYDQESGCLYYMVDYDEDKDEGTLVCWNGKKAVTIADEVVSFVYAGEGQVLYLYDYSSSSYKGELYSWNGKKAVKLDDDVTAIYAVDNAKDE